MNCYWCGRPNAVMGAEPGIPDEPGCEPDCPRDADGTPLPFKSEAVKERGGCNWQQCECACHYPSDAKVHQCCTGACQ